MTNIERLRIYHEAIDHYGMENQLEMVQEECSELIQAISKYKRLKSIKTINNIVDELVDVHIMVNQLRVMLSIPLYDLNNQIDYKLNRLQQRIKEDK